MEFLSGGIWRPEFCLTVDSVWWLHLQSITVDISCHYILSLAQQASWINVHNLLWTQWMWTLVCLHPCNIDKQALFDIFRSHGLRNTFVIAIHPDFRFVMLGYVCYWRRKKCIRTRPSFGLCTPDSIYDFRLSHSLLRRHFLISRVAQAWIRGTDLSRNAGIHNHLIWTWLNCL